MTILTDQKDVAHFTGGQNTGSGMDNSSITIIGMRKDVKWYSYQNAKIQFNLEGTSYVYIAV